MAAVLVWKGYKPSDSENTIANPNKKPTRYEVAEKLPYYLTNGRKDHRKSDQRRLLLLSKKMEGKQIDPKVISPKTYKEAVNFLYMVSQKGYYRGVMNHRTS